MDKKIFNFNGEKHELSTKGDIEVDICKETGEEMDAVMNMIKQANEQGLLTEVVVTAISDNSELSISSKCLAALYEWDC